MRFLCNESITMLLRRNDFKILLVLALPLLFSGMVESSIGFISGIFLAKLSPLAFGAGSMSAWFFATLMVIIWGVLTSISTLVSRYHGANDIKAVGNVLREAIWLCLILVIPTSLLIWNFGPLLYLFGQKPNIVAMTIPYMHALTWGLLPDFISLVLLQFIIGLGHTRTNLFFTLFWVPINIALNYIFIFGKLGLPAFGIAGLGWGTTCSYWLITLVLILFLIWRKNYHPYISEIFSLNKPKYLWELMTVGLPMGLMYFLEVGFFFTMALIMGHYGVDELAASQLTMQYVGLFVTLVFSTAQAVTVRMGNQIGAKNLIAANSAVLAGLILSFSFIFFVAIIEWLFPHWLIQLDFNPTRLHDPAMVQMTVSFLAIAAFFQLCESLRLTLFGALRALKDTHFTLFSSFIAFWGVAIPLGYLLANVFSMGAYGYWWALSISGIPNILLLFWRYNSTMKLQSYSASNLRPCIS